MRPQLSSYTAMSPRRCFTLIEVMIAFGLVAILISTLMGFYWQMNRLQVESDQIRRQAFHLRFLQSRLSNVLPRAVQPTPAPVPQGQATPEAAATAKEPEVPNAFFYISERDEMGVLSAPSLVFSYDNGKDLDTLFCGVVLGRLYRAENEGKGELWLATWPRPSCSTNAALVRKELLMSNVRRIGIECYQPPKMIQPASAIGAVAASTTPVEGPPEDTWSTTWKLAYRKLPAIIKLRIILDPTPGAKQSEELIFYFPIPNSNQPITIIQ